MNKKILIGSIIAVVILVLVSFTGVVGYQTTKSSTIKGASPLFTVRSSRAIDEESDDFTCDYVGKGEEIAISIPKRNYDIALIQKVIDRISRMDDKVLNKLMFSVIKHVKQNGRLTDIDNNKIINALNQLKDNQETTAPRTLINWASWLFRYGIIFWIIFLIEFIALILLDILLDTDYCSVLIDGSECLLFEPLR